MNKGKTAAGKDLIFFFFFSSFKVHLWFWLGLISSCLLVISESKKPDAGWQNVSSMLVSVWERYGCGHALQQLRSGLCQ